MLYEAGATTRSIRAQSGPVTVRAAEPTTNDRASVVALAAGGAIVGRATVSRLYGARGEVQLELAPTTEIALALIDTLEGSARGRGLAQLELDSRHASEGVIAALRGSRAARQDQRSSELYVTWPTTKNRVTA
jgi:hypothetical protein